MKRQSPAGYSACKSLMGQRFRPAYSLNVPRHYASYWRKLGSSRQKKRQKIDLFIFSGDTFMSQYHLLPLLP